MRLLSDRRYEFALSPTELWAQIDAVPSYPVWWPWLREFDGVALAVGEVWHCAVQPPLPYMVRFQVVIDAVEQPSYVAATISGDVVGRAELHINARHDGCEARLLADLGPEKSALRALSIAARPLVRFGHNWVLDAGARQFRARP